MNEYVLVVPQKLTMVAKGVLYSKPDITPLSYHLEGRYGSRIHRIDESCMGLPLFTTSSLSSSSSSSSSSSPSSMIINDSLIKVKSEDAKIKLNRLVLKYDDLRQLLDMDGVSLICKPYQNPAAHRARSPPSLDARIHPELEQRNEIKGNRNEITTPGDTPLFSYAELFAGMGGFGVALDKLGGRCVFCSELEEHLRNIFHHNFITIPNNRNRSKTSNKQQSCSANTSNNCNDFKDESKNTINPHNNNVDDDNIHIPMHGNIYDIPDDDFPDPASELDLLVAGFPCQPFSALGEQPGFDCPKAGNLFLEITRFLKRSQPKAFLLENVPGLKTMTETYTHIVKALEVTGYDVSTEVMSARGLTVTGRKRLFFVGLRRSRQDDDKVATKIFEFPFVPDLQLTFRDILDYDTLPAEELEILRLGESTFNQLLTNKRTWRPSSLAWPNLKGDTLTSHYGNAVGRGESQLVPCCSPHRPRRFSMREMARCMGFPNVYEFLPIRERQSPMAYRKENYRMIGNAVCPPLVAVLAGAVLDHCAVPPLKPNDKDEHHCDWVQQGRKVAVELAMSVTRSEPVCVPRGCLVHA